MVGLQTLDLAIGVRVPASQPKKSGRKPQALAAETTRCEPGSREDYRGDRTGR
jgi:hypothetical protein